MPHPDAEHSLRIQLATALREANALHTRALNAEERAKRESEMRWGMEKERGEVNEALKAEMARADTAESALAAANARGDSCFVAMTLAQDRATGMRSGRGRAQQVTRGAARHC